MRTTARLLSLALAVSLVPTVGAARGRDDDDDAPRGRHRGEARRAAPVHEAPRPDGRAYAPAPATYRAAAPAPRVHVRPRVAFLAGFPFWWSVGWGWGYRPIYPLAPPRDPYAPGGYAEPDSDRLSARLSLAAAGMAGARDGGLGGISLAVDGRDLGANFAFDVLSIEGVTGPADSTVGADTLRLGSAHLTWSFLADEAFRLRAELGVSVLAMPSSGVFGGTTYAGDTAYGPDLGIAGQIGLVGPLGVEGHARITPYPVPVLDTRLAGVVRGGPLAVTLGWRTVRVEGDGVDAPEARFEGPEVGVAVAF